MPPAVRAVQASHACLRSAAELDAAEGIHPSLVLLSVDSEKSLLEEARRLDSEKLPCTIFYEDDLSQYTALASGRIRDKRLRRLFQKLPLLA